MEKIIRKLTEKVASNGLTPRSGVYNGSSRDVVILLTETGIRLTSFQRRAAENALRKEKQTHSTVKSDIRKYDACTILVYTQDPAQERFLLGKTT